MSQFREPSAGVADGTGAAKALEHNDIPAAKQALAPRPVDALDTAKSATPPVVATPRFLEPGVTTTAGDAAIKAAERGDQPALAEALAPQRVDTPSSGVTAAGSAPVRAIPTELNARYAGQPEGLQRYLADSVRYSSELSPDSLKSVVETRKAIQAPPGTSMVKFIPKAAADALLRNDFGGYPPGTVGGSVARAADVAPFKTLPELRDGLSLDDSATIAAATKARAEAMAAGRELPPGDGSWSPIPLNATEAYQLRWTAGDDATDKMFIPFGGPTGEDFGHMRPLVRDLPPFNANPLVEKDRPFTGNGTTLGGVPEWLAIGARTPNVGMWKLDQNGAAKPYARYDPLTRTWKPA